MATSSEHWERLDTEASFVANVVNRQLSVDGIRFEILSDGTISGYDGAERFSGSWYWESGFFCRIASFDGEDLIADCEVIEICGDRMRYTRNKGRGTSAIVIMEPR